MENVVSIMAGTVAMLPRAAAGLVLALASLGLISREAPATTLTEFPVPTADSGVFAITVGSDDALWFTEARSHKIGRITTTGAFSEYQPPTRGQPRGITTGPDGALWFTERLANRIGRLTTSGTFTEYVVPTPRAEPHGITAGPDGALWFTESNVDKIGRITTTGEITEFSLPPFSRGPFVIEPGPDGALWFTATIDAKIMRITTEGSVMEFPNPSGGGLPYAITTGPDGALWFTEGTGDRIGRITTAGEFSHFPLPTTNGTIPNGITAGPDGALWFTDAEDSIWRITTDGAFTEFPLPVVPSTPERIVAGPDGALWFTMSWSNKIGRLEPTPPTAYPRPKGATPVRFSLVPAYPRCTAPDRQHGGPLAHGSCAAPSQESSQLTVGTPDANGRAAASVGSLAMQVLPNDPGTSADDADLKLSTAITDVRRRSDLAAYPGELRASVRIRLTDGGPTAPMTVEDLDLGFDIPCRVPTGGDAGSTCELVTSADAVFGDARAARSKSRAIWQLEQLHVYDGGDDGRGSTTEDNTLFETQGVFVP